VTSHEVSTRDLFVSLEGHVFLTYRDFDRAVQEALGRYRSAFPLTYTPHQAIAWARQNGWITDSGEGLLVEVR
jgi:hypothetical protein